METNDARFKSVSGFVYETDMIEVLGIYMKGAGVVPPVFQHISKELATGRTGFYVGLNVALPDDEMEMLRVLLHV